MCECQIEKTIAGGFYVCPACGECDNQPILAKQPKTVEQCTYIPRRIYGERLKEALKLSPLTRSWDILLHENKDINKTRRFTMLLRYFPDVSRYIVEQFCISVEKRLFVNHYDVINGFIAFCRSRGYYIKPIFHSHGKNYQSIAGTMCRDMEDLRRRLRFALTHFQVTESHEKAIRRIIQALLSTSIINVNLIGLALHSVGYYPKQISEFLQVNKSSVFLKDVKLRPERRARIEKIIKEGI